MVEHLPRYVRNYVAAGPSHSVNKPSMSLASSIAKHILDSGHSIDHNKAFTIIFRSRNFKLLRIAEAVVINQQKPQLCVHKRLLVDLQLPWN